MNNDKQITDVFFAAAGKNAYHLRLRKRVNGILFEESKEKRAALVLHEGGVTERMFLEMAKNILEWNSERLQSEIANHLRDLERGN